MAGASAETRRVAYVNANWTAAGGGFELLVVTEDEQRHAYPVPPKQMSALVALTQVPGAVLLHDPEGPTLIVGNLVGEWIPTTWSSLGQPG